MFFERHGGGERAILVHLDGQDPEAREDPQEFQELALSAGAETVAFVSVPRHRPTAKYLVGSGKVEELRDLVKAEQVDLVIFNHILTPSQERNLERVFECRVIDRTGLILDIFAQRARTHEGKLQVELAQLEHMSTRLVRGWTHLERQKGGIGLRGPGETQLETDRRLLRVRLRQIKRAWRRFAASVSRPVVAASVRISLQCPWWATPTPASPRCSMRSLRPMFSLPTNCSPPSTPPCAGLSWMTWGRLCWPIPWGSSATCRTSWSRRFGLPSKNRATPICCCM